MFKKHIEITIRKAIIDDLPEIVRIAQLNSLEYRKAEIGAERLEKIGFLVSEYSFEDYYRLVADNPLCLVSLQGGQITGFLIGYDSEQLSEESSVNRTMLKFFTWPFAVIKQISVDPTFMGCGCGRALYGYFCDMVKKDVAAVVVVDGSIQNKGSVAFHKRLGFVPTVTATESDGMRRWIFLREHESSSNRRRLEMCASVVE